MNDAFTSFLFPQAGDDGHWVDPNRTRSKSDHPYSYDAFFLFGDRAAIKKKGVISAYSDRMRQWDGAKYEAALAAAGKRSFQQMNRRTLQTFVDAFYGDGKYAVVALAEECNVGNGFPVFILYLEDKAGSA